MAFLFPGQGAQYEGMTLGLYESEPVYRQHVDGCAELLRRHVDFDIRDIIFRGETAGRRVDLNQTALAQPALFVVEYALAQTWMRYGVTPEGMIGHSVGEYVAACLAGVFTLEDALAVIALRGRLVQGLPGGSMLSVPLSQAECEAFLRRGVCLASVNGPRQCVLSGPSDAIADLAAELSRAAVQTRRLHTSHAFHSSMMDPVLEELGRRLESVELSPPRTPFLSNVTGTWIRPEEATNPHYWTQHLRGTVRFYPGVQELTSGAPRVLLEVGPGNTLTSLARSGVEGREAPLAVSSVRHPSQERSDRQHLLTALGKLWSAGVKVNWAGGEAGEVRRRVPLPTYPFEKKRCWIEPPPNVELRKYGYEFRLRAPRSTVETPAKQRRPPSGSPLRTAGTMSPSGRRQSPPRRWTGPSPARPRCSSSMTRGSARRWSTASRKVAAGSSR